MERWRSWTLDCPDGWSHHGLAVLADGTIVGYHPRERALLLFDGDGALVRTVPCDATEAHDIAIDGEHLWIADCGNKLSLDADGRPFPDPPVEEAVGRVLLVDLDGHTIRTIERPGEGLFLPTGVAVDERGVWVADGYGSNQVHLVGHDGTFLITLDGFDCPHGIVIDRRRDEPLLYIAERGARRLVVHDLDGRFVRHVAEGELRAPCAMTTVDDRMYVADLVARVTVLDLDDRVVGHVGVGRGVARREGWPNATDAGRAVPPPLEDGAFNSPHGIAAIGDDIVVTEWLLGGRWVRCST